MLQIRRRGLRSRRALLRIVTVAAALLLASVTTEAVAATTYTPTGGPAVSFVASVKRSSTQPPSAGAYLELIESAQWIDCKGFSLGGSVASPGISRAYGSNAASLGALTTTGCTNGIMGPTTFTALTTPGFAITGDRTAGGQWPARINNVRWAVHWANCDFYISGFINGKLDPVTGVFTPLGNPRPPGEGVAVGLMISDTPAPPTGSMCVTVDVQAGDTVGLTGTFANVPPSPSTGLTIANP